MRYLFATRNPLIKDEESYTICNLKPINESVYYSDDENSATLEDHYVPKWRRVQINSCLNSYLLSSLNTDKEILKRSVDFYLKYKVYICTLTEFEQLLYTSYDKNIQPETLQIAQLNTEIEKMKASRPRLFSFLYSLTYYNENLRTSIANTEHRRDLLLAIVKVRRQKEINELKSILDFIAKEAKKYSSEYIVFNF